MKYSKVGEFGSDALYDPNCHGPRSTIGLSLYFWQEKQLHWSKYGGHWKAFWWWTSGGTWPKHEEDVLQHVYGTCSRYDYYCFQRLPSWAQENFTELLAIDSKGTVYQWKFDSTNPTAHAVWTALHDHILTPYKKVVFLGNALDSVTVFHYGRMFYISLVEEYFNEEYNILF